MALRKKITRVKDPYVLPEGPRGDAPAMRAAKKPVVPRKKRRRSVGDNYIG